MSEAFIFQNRNDALVSSSTRSSTRRPAVSHQRVKATTYRPAKPVRPTTYRPPRLGQGSSPPLIDQGDQRQASLHRRADDYKPPRQQLLQIPLPEEQKNNPQRHLVQIPLPDDNKYNEALAKLQEEYQRNQQQLEYYKELLKQQSAVENQRILSQPTFSPIQTTSQPLPAIRPDLPQSIKPSGFAVSTTTAKPLDPAARRQLYQQLLEEYDRGQSNPDAPSQYRLLPYQNTQHHGLLTIVEPIQRSVDLDLKMAELQQ